MEMKTIIIALIAAAISGVVCFILGSAHRKKTAEGLIGSANEEATRIVNQAVTEAETKKREALLEAKEETLRMKNESEREIKESRAEVQRYERRILAKEEQLDKKAIAMEKRELNFANKEERLAKKTAEIDELYEKRVQELERISGLTSEQAKEYLLKAVEDEVKTDAAKLVRELENKAKDGCRLIVVTNKPLHILGEDIIFRVHTLEEEVRANNFVARSETSKFTQEFAEMDFQNFYNAKTDYQDLTAWFKFEWSDSEEILYTFEDTSDPKYALHKKHKMIAALKKHGKGEVILTTLSCLDGGLGYNPALDKLIINFIEKE